MKELLYKEARLSAHPTAYLFLALSAMLLIPNYPYYLIFFYTALGLFFVCLGGRENRDIEYSLSLPVARDRIVGARMVFAALIELAQTALAVPFMALRGKLAMPVNEAGMDANIALLGLSLIMMGLFNWVFFRRYYRAPDKVGAAFAWGAAAMGVYITAAETCAHALPFVRDQLDTPDPAFLGEKLVVLAIGLTLFALLTLLAYRQASKRFAALDL